MAVDCKPQSRRQNLERGITEFESDMFGSMKKEGGCVAACKGDSEVIVFVVEFAASYTPARIRVCSDDRSPVRQE